MFFFGVDVFLLQFEPLWGVVVTFKPRFFPLLISLTSSLFNLRYLIYQRWELILLLYYYLLMRRFSHLQMDQRLLLILIVLLLNLILTVQESNRLVENLRNWRLWHDWNVVWVREIWHWKMRGVLEVDACYLVIDSVLKRNPIIFITRIISFWEQICYIISHFCFC